VTYAVRRRLASSAIVAGLVLAGTPALCGPAAAARPVPVRSGRAQPSDTDPGTRALEVRFANAHWNWTAWNDSTPAAPGSAQPNYQCAEFVARALAAAALVPGLTADTPQSDYGNYTAPNGKVYDLLLISSLPQHNNLYAYLMDSGLGQDVGDQAGQAQPGDIVVTHLGAGSTPSHTGLVAQAGTATSEATVDAHNNARLDYGYHYYAPSHLVRLVPNALLEVWSWATAQRGRQRPTPPPPAPRTITPPGDSPAPTRPTQPRHQPTQRAPGLIPAPPPKHRSTARGTGRESDGCAQFVQRGPYPEWAVSGESPQGRDLRGFRP